MKEESEDSQRHQKFRGLTAAKKKNEEKQITFHFASIILTSAKQFKSYGVGYAAGSKIHDKYIERVS